jgi:hypothetical protein
MSRIHLRLILLTYVPSDPHPKYLMTRHRQRHARKGGSVEICPGGLMAPWIYDDKFLTGMRFMFRTLPFTVGEDDELEQLA